MKATDTHPTPHVLVIDDEPDLRALYELTLLREGYRVTTAGSVAEARAQLADQGFDLVITDMRLPDGLGLELVKEAGAHDRSERCIVITAYGSTENAVEALKAGAFDYLTKPVDLKRFRTVVADAIAQPRASAKNERPDTAVPTSPGQTGTPVAPQPLPTMPAAPSAAPPSSDALGRLVGNSAVMAAVKQRIAKVARSMAPILVRGESGTGKELAARAIHDCSHRASGPFVAVNCSAIPENLLEAEFFGARKGSYTGATQDRQGFFQAAKGGTLFLDEIGDLPLAMQSKLLRAIQERSVRALGCTTEEAVDVRIVSATHKDLEADVQAGHFRQDLYYRLNVIEIVLPPLRQRRADLPALCEALLQRIAQASGQPVPALSAHFLASLQQLPLEGNVRELENLLHRAVALSEGDELMADTLAPCPAPVADEITMQPPPVGALGEVPPPAAPMAAASPSAPNPLDGDLQNWLDRQERAVLLRTLHETGFNRTAAAAKLGLNLRQIRYRMARLHIVAPGDDHHAQPSDEAC